MKSVVFKMKLKQGYEKEYKKRHDEIWPELADELSKVGVSDYSIFLDEETNILFAVQKLAEKNTADQLPQTEIVKKWWDYMADIMDVNPDNSPVVVGLKEVFQQNWYMGIGTLVWFLSAIFWLGKKSKQIMHKNTYYLIPVLLAFLIVIQACGNLSQNKGGKDTVNSVPFFEETTLWEHEEDDAWPYHVYGLVQSKKGTLLAFAEGRVEMYDKDPHHLVLKRSTDDGRSWSKNIYIEKSDGSFWGDNGQPGKMEAWLNTGPIVDVETGRIFFFYALNDGTHHQRETRVFYRYSDDDGMTWQPRIEMTQLFADNPHGWTFHMPGPGHGIQLQNQRGVNANRNGRLVMAVWHRRARTANPRLYGISLLISDDHGKTWSHTGDAGIGYGMSEARLIELEDGRILMNARGGEAMRDGKKIDTQKHRVYAWSEDAGKTFGGHEVKKEFVYSKNGCDSSIKRYARHGKNILLFSRPANLEARAQMTMSISEDEGRTWSQHKLIHDGSSFYSDIVVMPNGTIGLLYGQGKDDRHQQLPHHVSFARFNIEWLLL